MFKCHWAAVGPDMQREWENRERDLLRKIEVLVMKVGLLEKIRDEPS